MASDPSLYSNGTGTTYTQQQLDALRPTNDEADYGFTDA
jgi:hypothetical protein